MRPVTFDSLEWQVPAPGARVKVFSLPARC